MLLHENTLISLEILEEEFVCNLSMCKGMCCVEGEYGAPLEEEEIGLIREALPAVMPYLSPAAKKQIGKQGFYEKDSDNEFVTQCISGRDCVFAISENNVYKCGMEKAFNEGKTAFKKPVSCHLYPIRLTAVGGYVALNYDRWHLCSSACSLGESLKVPVYKFLKEPLIRRFGAAWYEGLEKIAAEYAAAK